MLVVRSLIGFGKFNPFVETVNQLFLADLEPFLMTLIASFAFFFEFVMPQGEFGNDELLNAMDVGYVVFLQCAELFIAPFVVAKTRLDVCGVSDFEHVWFSRVRNEIDEPGFFVVFREGLEQFTSHI